MAGTKTFKAKNGVGSSIIPLSKIWYQLDDCNDMRFSVSLANSLTREGLIWPILVTTSEYYVAGLSQIERRPVPEIVSTPYRCLVGNNRLDFAQMFQYTHISALCIKTLDEYKQYMKVTFMEPNEL